jgi:inhibitor of KinA sporulation pathway (predicted exonuclease)
MKQLRTDLKRHGMEEPPQMRVHINLKQMFAERSNRKPCGMKKALDSMRIPLTGTHHRGIDDALNISKLAKMTFLINDKVMDTFEGKI